MVDHIEPQIYIDRPTNSSMPWLELLLLLLFYFISNFIHFYILHYTIIYYVLTKIQYCILPISLFYHSSLTSRAFSLEFGSLICVDLHNYHSYLSHEKSKETNGLIG